MAASSGASVSFVLAIAPSVFLFCRSYHADKYKQEWRRLLGATFLIGALSIIPAITFEGVFRSFEPPSDAGFFPVFLYYLFGVGLVEEFMKFLSLRACPYRSSHFDNPIGGIVFGVAAGLGFATSENVSYLFQSGVQTAIIRALVSVPSHALLGAIIGFYLAEAKIRVRPLLALGGLGIAVFLHGLFDALSSLLSKEIILFFMVLCLVCVVYFEVVKNEVAGAKAELPYPKSSPAFD